MRAASWPEPIRHSEEVLLVDRVQQRDYRPLDDLVLQGSDRERALPAVWLRYVYSPAWPRPIRSASDPIVQIFEIALEVRLVVLPRQPVHARCRVHIEFVEHVLKKIDADVVEERDELLLLPFPCDFPYALQRMWHAGLALCTGHGLLARISLGPRPWLRRLRCNRHRRRLLRSKLFRFVRRLHSYYGRVRLLVPVHHRLRLLAFPMRTVPLTRRCRSDTRPPSFRCDPVTRDVAFDPGRASAPRMTVPHMLPSSE